MCNIPVHNGIMNLSVQQPEDHNPAKNAWYVRTEIPEQNIIFFFKQREDMTFDFSIKQVFRSLSLILIFEQKI